VKIIVRERRVKYAAMAGSKAGSEICISSDIGQQGFVPSSNVTVEL
jgi:hypothetical protein